MMSSLSIAETIRFASIVSVVFPLIIYLIRAKELSGTGHKLGAILVISTLSDLLALYLFQHKLSTVLLFNVYYLLFFLLLAWFYSDVLSDRTRRRVVVGVMIYAIGFLFVTVFLQALNEYQTMLWTLAGAITIVFSISYFLNVFSTTAPTEDSGLLWINSGILFYFSFNLFLFVIGKYILTELEPELGFILWSFHNVNNIIKNILIGFGIRGLRGDNVQAMRN
jgi:hypothetical protein